MRKTRPTRKASAAGMRWLVLACMASLCFAGCASSSLKVQPLGPDTFRVSCHGGYHNWTGCENLAARTCGKRSFLVLARVSDEGSAGVGVKDWSREGSEVKRFMDIKCAGTQQSSPEKR